MVFIILWTSIWVIEEAIHVPNNFTNIFIKYLTKLLALRCKTGGAIPPVSPYINLIVVPRPHMEYSIRDHKCWIRFTGHGIGIRNFEIGIDSKTQYFNWDQKIILWLDQNFGIRDQHFRLKSGIMICSCVPFHDPGIYPCDDLRFNGGGWRDGYYAKIWWKKSNQIFAGILYMTKDIDNQSIIKNAQSSF